MYANVNAAPFMGAHANVAPSMMDNVAPSMMDNIPPVMGAYDQPHHTAPFYGYGHCPPTRGYDNFVLIVVLFILLIIVGAYGFTKC